MAQRRTLTVTEEQRDELLDHRDHDPRPQMRERCAALVRVVDGEAAYAVARSGVVKPRDPDAIYSWMTYYEQGGIAGLAAHLHGGSQRGRLRSSTRGSRARASPPSPASQ